MDIIFNELSLDGKYSSEFEALNGLKRFIKACNILVRIGYNRTLLVTYNFSSLPLSKGLSLYYFLKKLTVDERNFLLAISTKKTYIEDALKKEKIENDDIKIFWGDKEGLGLGLSYYRALFVISFDSNKSFCTDDIAITVKKCVGHIWESKSKNIISIWSENQSQKLICSLRKMLVDKIEDGRSLLYKFEKIFPCLFLGEDVKEQLRVLNKSDMSFDKIKAHLLIINDTMSYYTKGPFKPMGIEWSTESKSTKEKYRGERSIKCPDGQYRLFLNHSKIRSNIF